MIRVSVNSQDIQTGLPRTLCDCPIAKALKRRFPNSHIHVSGAWGIHIGDTTYTAVYATGKVNSFIEKFDRGDNVKPIKFCIYKKRKKNGK